MASEKEVISWLDQATKLDTLIAVKIAERDRLLDMAQSIVPGMDDMPHGGGVTDKVGNVAIKLADLAAETDALVDQYIAVRKDIDATLQNLPAMQYGVLQLHYLQGVPFVDIAKRMNKSIMQVYRYRNGGVEGLKKILAS